MIGPDFFIAIEFLPFFSQALMIPNLLDYHETIWFKYYNNDEGSLFDAVTFHKRLDQNC